MLSGAAATLSFFRIFAPCWAHPSHRSGSTGLSNLKSGICGPLLVASSSHPGPSPASSMRLLVDFVTMVRVNLTIAADHRHDCTEL